VSRKILATSAPQRYLNNYPDFLDWLLGMRFFGISKAKLTDKDIEAWTSPIVPNGTIIMRGWQTYYHIFFLPLVPSDKEIKLFCKTSKEEIRLDIPPIAIAEVKVFKQELKTPLWMYIGFPAIAAFIVFISL